MTGLILRSLFFTLLSVILAGAQSVIHVSAGGDLQDALDRAQPGDTITLEPGATYQGNFLLRKKDGDVEITITTADPSTLPPDGVRISPGYSAVLPKIVAPNNVPAIATDPGAARYRLVGLEVYAAPGVYSFALIRLGRSETTQLSELASEIVLDRLYIHGDARAGGKRGVELNSSSTLIKNCYISDIKSTFQDAQAIEGWNGSGPFEITNNFLEASGENIMFGGALPRIENLVPSDIVIRNNHFYKPMSWRIGHPTFAGTKWSVKNLLELKNARRVTREGNVFENSWVNAQTGFAILLTVRTEGGRAPWAVVEDVRIVKNIVRNTHGGVNMLGRDGAGQGLGTEQRILIQDNLFYEIGSNQEGKLLQVLRGVIDLTVDHNTFIADTNLIVIFEGEANPRFAFTNNISTKTRFGVVGTGTIEGIRSLDRYAPASAVVKNVMFQREALYPPGNFFPESLGDIGFTDFANHDCRLGPASPYKGVGTDGKDLGADIEAVLEATAGVAPPVVVTVGDAAGYTGGAVAACEMITIQGAALGPVVPAGMALTADGDFVTTALGGVRVLFDGEPAPMIYASDTQVTAVVLSKVVEGAGTTELQLEYNGVLSAAATLPVAEAVPGVFTVSASGGGQGAVLNWPDYSLNGPDNPALIGSALVVYGTSGGLTEPPCEDGRIVESAQPFQGSVSAALGGVAAKVLYAGAAPGLVAGVVQFNLEISEDVPVGDAVPLRIGVGSALSQPGVTVAIAPAPSGASTPR